jgi:hypothetical protein
MKQRDLFLMADAALREVIDMLDLDQLTLAAPAEWSREPEPTVRDILAAHAYDEAWIPDLLAGKTIEEVGDRWSGDLLGDDPIERYDELNDAATEAMVSEHLDPHQLVHFSYGDFPLAEGLIHVSMYRAFQAWSIAHLVGLEYQLPEALVDLLWDELIPRLDEFRALGVFPPEVAVLDAADKETRLLGKTGYLVP